MQCAGEVTQVRQIFRAITPAEYDFATRNAPHLCPLFAMGDKRSGTELINQTRTDMREPFRHLRRRTGDIAQHALVAFLTAKLAEMESRCSHSGEIRAATAAIAHAAPAPPQLLTDPPAAPVPHHRSLVRGSLRHLWSVGYRANALAALLDLPVGLLTPFRRAVDAEAVLDRRRLGALYRRAAMTAGSDGEGVSDQAARLWEAEAEAGYLEVRYDGATGRRQAMAMNRRHAELMGAGREEALELLRRDGAPLPAPESDMLAWLLQDLSEGNETQTERYCRMWVGGSLGAGGMAALAHCTVVRRFNQLGHVTQALLMFS